MWKSDDTRRLLVCLALAQCLAAACSADKTPGGRALDPNPGRGIAGGSGGNLPPGSGAATSNPGRNPGSNPSPTGVPIGDDCAAISQTAVNRLQPADIIFAIDNSGSMDEEIVFVREQMNAFSQQIVDSGIDVRIIVVSAPRGNDIEDIDIDPGNLGGVIDAIDDLDENGICIDPPLGSGTCPEDSMAPRYLHVPEEVGSHDALNLFVSTFPDWRSQLRPNATKTFVVVSDDDATEGPNNSAAAFSQAVAALDPALFARWTLSGIYCFSECPESANVGQVYMDLVTQTQGVAGDLCLQDFAPVFDALARSVISGSGVDCQWDIPPAPPGETFAVGKVNVQYTAAGAAGPQSIFHVGSANDCGAQGGWFYDDNASPTRLGVCPATCQVLQGDSQAKLDVLFGCATRGPD